MKIVFAVLALVASVAANAGQLEYGRQAVRAGQSWSYASTTGNVLTYTVTAVRPDGSYEVSLERKQGRSSALVYDADGNLLSSNGHRYAPKQDEFHLPLKAGMSYGGNAYEYAHPSKPGVTVKATMRVTEVTEERITVPAGTYDALRVALRTDYRLSSGYSNYIESVVWLVPGIGKVRIDHVDWGKPEDRWTNELTAASGG